MKVEKFIEYELHRKTYLIPIKNKFHLTRDELLLLGIFQKFNYNNEIYLTDFIYLANKYNVYYNKPLKTLASKNFFKKKRLIEDERTVIIYDIDYKRINQIFEQINLEVFQ
ncbi:transcriptional regulator, SarA/Rot family [Mammaliicoccus sciuri]|uniref:transcriptional regulator, SarA/Rot family n=1 Tax=Mammaliicoccus sciuri TaxID=1296 RepID=UPI000CD0AF3B|nr:hypothetical protein [Mammaliicoccus sciuri]PNZ24629.1 hypothetical protein CD114_12540 [Mammaliicoccus sciuri]